ncbi:M4 family metallopeptidase [Cytobacillus oceanisediminis]|uniref:M4 family metallopeptidase n=1 Tax=Cytobacillus oceanisediminis TaxID=665099 RepID=UPI00203D0345|nr:M4 family metallopeptidase [Cytobacillus oceanisediminis]MCM3392398.1 M4 family metallopeptidase [Cytobacillus oceanisediminis]
MKRKQLKKKVLPAVLAASFAISGLSLPAKNVLANEEIVKYHQELKTPSYIIGNWQAPEGLSKEEAVFAFLQSKANLFKNAGYEAKDQFKIIDQFDDKQTNTHHFRTVEQYNGIPVYGSQQTIALDEKNNVTAFFGKVTPNLARSIIPTEAKLGEDEALEKAKESIEDKIGEVKSYDGIEGELVIYPHNGQKHLAYYVTASTSAPAPGYWHYFVDAVTGNIIHSYNAIAELTPSLPEQPEAQRTASSQPAPKALPTVSEPVQARGMDIFGTLQSFQAVKDPETGTHYLFDGTRSEGVHTFKANRMPENAFIILSALLGMTGFEVESRNNFFYDPSAVSAHVNAGKVYDYYKKVHGRDSLDGEGMKLVSTVHIGSKWNNAAWNGKQMLYGDGDGTRMISLSGGLDVIGHEMTHGVITNTADLIYENESGAINESIADILGAFAENKTGEDLWLLGEDIWTPNTPGDGLRSMSDPGSVYIGGYTESGYYPDHYSKRYIGELDKGGVHINSSINNKAAHLITDGGTHYGVTVSGIGKTKAEKIFFRALTHYLTASSDFSQMRQAAIQAARDLHPDRNGQPSAEVKAVMAAYDAVGVQ